MVTSNFPARTNDAFQDMEVCSRFVSRQNRYPLCTLPCRSYALKWQSPFRVRPPIRAMALVCFVPFAASHHPGAPTGTHTACLLPFCIAFFLEQITSDAIIALRVSQQIRKGYFKRVAFGL